MTEKELYIAFLAAIPGIIIGLSGVVREWWRDRNRPRVDLSSAEKTDAEAEKIRAEAQLLADQHSRELMNRIIELTKRVDNTERAFKIIIAFARMHYDGSKILYDQVMRYETPKFTPSEKFPDVQTGPLGVGTT